MAEQWIAASVARGLIAKGPLTLAAERALFSRCGAGLVKTRAKLLTVDSRSLGSLQIPPEFWQKKLHEAHAIDWNAGDFSVQQTTVTTLRAYGVEFGLDGLLEMLPVEERPVVARALSIVGNREWASAKESVDFAMSRCKFSPATAPTAIMDSCRLGFISARAVLAQFKERPRDKSTHHDEREWLIPLWYWENFGSEGSSHKDWQRGLFSGVGKTPWGRNEARLTGVHFLKSSLDVLLPRDSGDEQKVDQKPAATNQGGRPTAQFWDEMWAEFAARLYSGDHKPNSQADVARIMTDWIEANGYSAADSTIRERARRAWYKIEATET